MHEATHDTPNATTPRPNRDVVPRNDASRADDTTARSVSPERLSYDVIDLFAGPGGIDEGLRLAGFTGRLLGIDHDTDACATARAAGHHREQADLTDYPLEHHAGTGVDGLVGSPSCREHSPTGRRRGLDSAVGRLSLVPCRWALALRPRWVMLEQVPQALPVYQQTAAHLERVGYRTWTGVVHAVGYVAQDRKRAVMLARNDGQPVGPPPRGDRVSAMADALGWSGAELVSNNGTGGDPKARGRRSMDRPSFTLTGKCRRNRWEWPDGSTRVLSVEEASILQGFPPDHPWQGGSTSVQQQIGDAVPPPLAAALVAQFLEPAAEVAA